MRKKIERMVSKLNYRVMYFTENPLNFAGHEGKKYFLCWQNTHVIYKSFDTQSELIEELNDLLKRKFVKIGSCEFKVVDKTCDNKGGKNKMSKSDYISLLAKASKKITHELIEECLTTYNKIGTFELTIEELHNFCESKKLL